MANKQYTLGRGKVFFDAFTTGTTTTTGERYLGNTPAFSVSVEAETLEHFDADEGIRTKDASATLQVNRTANIEVDNIDVDNVALFFLSESTVQAQASAAGQTSVITSPLGDRYYQLGVTVGNPSGVRNVSAVSASVGVVTTDFTLDATLGRVYIVAGGAIDGEATVTFTHTNAATSRKQIITSSEATVDGSMRFLASNPKGAQFDYFMPSVKLSPNGEYALKGDDWQKMAFRVEINKRDDLTESIYIDGRPFTP